MRTSHLRLLADESTNGHSTLVESYRRLADVFHEVLAEQSLDALLVRIADTVGELIPHDTLTIYEADEAQGMLKPVLVVRDPYADEIMSSSISFAEGEGITGWSVSHREAVLANQAHHDPRVRTVPGTPIEPESLICVPLIARGNLKGALNVYRDGEDVGFSETEFELLKRFADAAALALDNAEIRARLEHQARTDSLTGLFNHSVFYERLLHALQEASRTHESVAVLMLDIDDFKHVNDVHGHAVGDELLRFLAESLRATVRPDDIVCRLGGEEFAVIMLGCADEDAVRVAERIKSRLGATEFPGIGRLHVSVGLALGPEHAMNPRELGACAEAAMMTAKAQGKNQIVLYCDDGTRRPDSPASARDVRSIAHLKMLQSLSGKLNRSNDVREIAEEIVAELRSLIDYHNCRVFVSDGGELIPVAFRGGLTTNEPALIERERLRPLPMGYGVTGRAAALGESLLVGDAANCEFGEQIPGTEPIEESLLAVPLRYGTNTIGVIVVSKLGLDQFDEDDVRLLEVLAGHAAVAVENARLYESARREADSATALLEFGRELATLVEIEEIVARITSLSSEVLGSQFTSLWLERDGVLRLASQHGHTPEWTARLSDWSLPVDRLRADSDPYVIGPEDYEGIVSEPSYPGGHYALAPFVVDGRAGLIAALVDRDDFGERELRLLSGLAHQAKLSIANASSYEGLERTFVSTVEALANALEANDEYTSRHARWITDLALRVGAELGLDERTLKRLELGALLHDIGKIGIPSDILAKPGRLTARERKIVQTHPELGERIIAPIDRLQSVRTIVRHCHERWDGRGYPDGAVGEDIPLEARIIFVCDAYHAMTTDRPYRRRLGHREALRRLAEAAGTQFDPKVVEVALRVLEEQRDEIAPTQADVRG